VVNYWAEWCGPCRHEIPELNALHAGDQDVPVTVLGVNYDGLRDTKLVEVLQRMGIEFPVLLDDPRGRWQQPLPSVLPSTLLIAPDGSLIETLQGPQTRAGILGRIEAAD
jgi:thiol-disulfide isomerase/thioredoxin